MGNSNLGHACAPFRARISDRRRASTPLTQPDELAGDHYA